MPAHHSISSGPGVSVAGSGCLFFLQGKIRCHTCPALGTCWCAAFAPVFCFCFVPCKASHLQRSLLILHGRRVAQHQYRHRWRSCSGSGRTFLCRSDQHQSAGVSLACDGQRQDLQRRPVRGSASESATFAGRDRARGSDQLSGGGAESEQCGARAERSVPVHRFRPTHEHQLDLRSECRIQLPGKRQRCPSR